MERNDVLLAKVGVAGVHVCEAGDDVAQDFSVFHAASKTNAI